MKMSFAPLLVFAVLASLPGLSSHALGTPAPTYAPPTQSPSDPLGHLRSTTVALPIYPTVAACLHDWPELGGESEFSVCSDKRGVATGPYLLREQRERGERWVVLADLPRQKIALITYVPEKPFGQGTGWSKTASKLLPGGLVKLSAGANLVILKKGALPIRVKP